MEWVDIKGFEGFYQINIKGEVRSLGRVVNNYPNSTRVVKGRMLKPYLGNCGYKRVDLKTSEKRKNSLLHRLIAIHFIPNPNNYPHINHKDGIKANNEISNLEWCTHKQNMRHGYDMGLIPKKNNPKGENGFSAKLKDNDVLVIKQRLKDGDRVVNIAKDYPATESAISEIKAGRSWGHL